MANLLMEPLNIAGALASLVGAFFALVQARRAHRSASEADRIRQQLGTRQRSVEVAALLDKLVALQVISRQLGATVGARQARGGKILDLRDQMQEGIDLLRSNLHHIAGNATPETHGELQKDLRFLQDSLNKFGEARSIEEQRQLQQDVHKRVSDFVALTKRRKDASALP